MRNLHYHMKASSTTSTTLWQYPGQRQKRLPAVISSSALATTQNREQQHWHLSVQDSSIGTQTLCCAALVTRTFQVLVYLEGPCITTRATVLLPGSLLGIYRKGRFLILFGFHYNKNVNLYPTRAQLRLPLLSRLPSLFCASIT